MAAQLSGKAAQSYDALRSRLLADPRVVTSRRLKDSW